MLDQRKHEAALAALRVLSEANKHGMLRSGSTALQIGKAYEETYDAICKDAWLQLHKIAITIGVKPDGALAGQLRDVFDEILKPLASRYLCAVRADTSIIDTMRDRILVEAETTFLRSRAIVGTEIDLFSRNTAMMVSQSGTPTYIQNYSFSGPVGAFQQGDYSSATVTQNIDTSQLEALRTALNALLEKFADHEQLEPLIRESKSEAAKSQPNLSSIRSLLAGIKACIALVRDGKDLFEVAEEAAFKCGMDALPPMSF